MGDVYDLREYKILNDKSAGSLSFAINPKGSIYLRKEIAAYEKRPLQRCNCR